MATHTQVHSFASNDVDDERWHAWLAKGRAHDRLVNRRLVFAVALTACLLGGGALLAFVLG